MTGIAIIGAGQSGATLAAQLRTLGYNDRICLFGAEPVAPYQRPPLSKAYLLGDMAQDRLLLRTQTFWEENGIDLRTNATVKALDADRKTITLEDGQTLVFDQIALTTGAEPRRLPAQIGGDLGRVFCVRSLADVDAMAPLIQPGARMVIIGGGYIGLEAAAVAAKSGLHVTLVEAAPRILQRVASPETSTYFRNLHRSHGVEMLEGTRLSHLVGDGVVSGVVLADGRQIDADIVIVGIGVTPRTALAAQAGLTVENGISTDQYGACSKPAIWAAGDCASFPYKDGRLRLESVGNAIDHADCVAANMMGAQIPYQPKPWFWSDQYDVKLQIAGLNTGHDSTVTRSGASEASQSIWYYEGARLVAVDAMNAPRDYMVGKRLIETGLSPDARVISDPDTNLKALLK